MISCQKNNPILSDKYITLAYPQTYCTDPWVTVLADDSLTLKNVSAYLTSNNLYIANLSIKRDSLPGTCSACYCKTGKKIYVTTLESDSLLAKYNRIGFK